MSGPGNRRRAGRYQIALAILRERHRPEFDQILDELRAGVAPATPGTPPHGAGVVGGAVVLAARPQQAAAPSCSETTSLPSPLLDVGPVPAGTAADGPSRNGHQTTMAPHLDGVSLHAETGGDVVGADRVAGHTPSCTVTSGLTTSRDGCNVSSDSRTQPGGGDGPPAITGHNTTTDTPPGDVPAR